MGRAIIPPMSSKDEKKEVVALRSLSFFDRNSEILSLSGGNNSH